MEAKETLGDGCGRNYANGQSANQNRQDAISRVSAQTRLCRIAQEARGKNTDGLAVEIYSHINSAGCEGMAMTVTAAHHSILRHLYTSMHAAKNPKDKLKFVTLIKESNMSTLWRREVFLRICSEEDLSEKTQAIEATKPVQKRQEMRYNFDPVSSFINCFGGRRLDEVAINENLQIVYILEFKRRRGVPRVERSRIK